MVYFKDGTLVKGAYVEIDGVQYPVHMPEYSGNKPVSAENLNKIQTDINKKIAEEDFINKVNFNESAVTAHCEFIKKGNMVFITYQGETKTHAAGTKLCTIPERL